MLDRPRSVVLYVTLLLGLAAPSSAAAVVCGETLTASVVLDADLLCPTGNGLVIGADGVTIDLGGHTLTGDNASDSVGIENAGGFDAVTVKNGTIRSFETQIRMMGGEGHVVRNVQLRSGDRSIRFEGTRFGKIVKVAALNPDGTAIQITGDDHQISQAVILRPISTGIRIAGNRNKVAKSTIVRPSGPGIYLVGGEQNVFSGNTISVGQSEGIRLDAFGGIGNVVAKNVCEGNAVEGIALVNVQEGVVTGNTVVGNGANGIRVGNASVGNLVAKNKAFGNAGSGIYVPVDSSFTTIVGNVAHRNQSRGVDSDSAIATLGKNKAELNANGGIEAPPGVVDAGGNKARSNLGFDCSAALACK